MITGAMLSPTDSYRLLQEVKTLKLRLTPAAEEHHRGHQLPGGAPAVKRVLYAGSHSEYEAQVHARQANGLGASPHGAGGRRRPAQPAFPKPREDFHPR